MRCVRVSSEGPSTPDPASAGRLDEIRPPAGVGLALRWAGLDAAGHPDTELPEALRSFELAPENFIARGGAVARGLAALSARRPLLAHGLAMNLGGHDPLERSHLLAVREFLDRQGIESYSEHLCWTAHGGSQLHELLPLRWDLSTLARVRARTRQIVDLLERPLRVENVCAYAAMGRQTQRDALERRAAFLHALFDGAPELGLLLDLSNLWIECEALGLDPEAALEMLPLSRVAEIHLAGPERVAALGGRWIDTHSRRVPAPVLALLESVLARCGPLPVIYERDHDFVLADALQEVVRIDRHYQRALTAYDGKEIEASPPAIRLASDASDSRAFDSLTAALLAPKLELEPGADPELPLSPEGLEVYRYLVRRGVGATLKAFFSRSLAQIDAARFEGWIEAFLAAGASASPYLRELPHDFVRFVERHEHEDPDRGPALALLRHEAALAACALAPEEEALTGAEPAPRLELGLRTPTSLRLLRHAYRVHAFFVDGTPPTPGEQRVALLRRSEEGGRVDCLELGPHAFALLEALHAGASLEAAIRRVAEQPAGALAPDALARAQASLRELAEAELVLGPAELG